MEKKKTVFMKTRVICTLEYYIHKNNAPQVHVVNTHTLPEMFFDGSVARFRLAPCTYTTAILITSQGQFQVLRLFANET
jgi:hypothetical protein